MAEEKPAGKPESKPFVPATASDVAGDLIYLFFILFIIGTLLSSLTGLFGKFGVDGGLSSGSFSVPWYERFTENGKLLSKSKPLSSIVNPIGMRVASIKDTDVYDSPGGKKIGSHKRGDAGRVIQGPIEINGERYWYVDYDTDPDGWVKESDVRSLTTPVSSETNPVGKRVMTTGEANLYDEFGNKTGTHKAGDKGKITKGPIEINGEKYWYVDFDNGEDGWVKEGDLGIIDDSQTGSEKFMARFFSWFSILRWFLYGFSLLCLFGIVYLWLQINSIGVKENKQVETEVVTSAPHVNPRWEKIVELSDSLNENDWRHAIIEADIMLGELLERMQLPGDTIGDKLKVVEVSDFNTVDNAWEAHKVRNNIAHEGSKYLLNQREVRRVVTLYQSVFEEFEII